MIRRISATLLTIALSACGPEPTPRVDAEFRSKVDAFNEETGARLIDVATLREKLERGEPVFLLDVREPEEHEVSVLAGARLVSPLEVDGLDLRPPPDATVVTYCTVGYRSGIAAVTLEERLGRPVYNLDGGIIAWFNRGGEVVDPGGREVDRIHPYSEEWGRYVRAREDR